jgi:hypothetical protein
MTKFLPLLVAIISAAVALFGYFYNKQMEREFEVRQTQQEIYTRLIINVAAKNNYFEEIRRDPRIPDRVTTANVEEFQSLIREEYPELQELINEAQEIMALLSVYGTDEAISAVARFYRSGVAAMQPNSSTVPDMGELILDLRRSLFEDTGISADDINLILSE